MIHFLTKNNWKDALIHDKVMWLPIDGDWNHDRALETVDAYLFELNTQRELEVARRRPKEQLVIDFGDDGGDGET